LARPEWNAATPRPEGDACVKYFEVNRMKLSIVLAALLATSVMAFGCSKDKKDEGSAQTTSASTSGKKKLPSASASKGKVSGKKGGSGSSKPAATSHKASASTVNATQKKKQDGDNPCAELPDGVAECLGDTLLVCDDKALWAIDCNGLMTAVHADLFTGGSCYETDTVTDCFGAGVAEDGVAEACTSDLSLCCDELGNCATH
jgi:hypothetical protein